MRLVMDGTRLVSGALLAMVGLLLLAAPAIADDPVLDAASYPEATTYDCRDGSDHDPSGAEPRTSTG